MEAKVFVIFWNSRKVSKALIPTAYAFINDACKAMTGIRLEWVEDVGLHLVLFPVY